MASSASISRDSSRIKHIAELAKEYCRHDGIAHRVRECVDLFSYSQHVSIIFTERNEGAWAVLHMRCVSADAMYEVTIF